MSRIKLVNDIIIDLNQAKNLVDDMECVIRDECYTPALKSRMIEDDARRLIALAVAIKSESYQLSHVDQPTLFKGV